MAYFYRRDRAIGKAVARILLNTERVGECLVWQGNTNQFGYGITGVAAALSDVFPNPRCVFAHIVICRFVHGKKKHKHYEVLHSCDVKPCVNPAHLSWGSRSRNIREAHERELAPHGEDHVSSSLTDDQIRDVLARNAAGEGVPALASEYGVSRSTIYRWKRGESRVKYMKGRDAYGTAA